MNPVIQTHMHPCMHTCIHVHTRKHTLVPRSIAAQMVEMEVSVNPLNVNFIITYVSKNDDHAECSKPTVQFYFNNKILRLFLKYSSAL